MTAIILAAANFTVLPGIRRIDTVEPKPSASNFDGFSIYYRGKTRQFSARSHGRNEHEGNNSDGSVKNQKFHMPTQ